MPGEAKTEPKTKEVPLFVSILILLCCLGAGGWFVWWYFQSPAEKVVAVLDAPPQANRPPRGPRSAGPRRPQRPNNNRPFNEGVRRVDRTHWLARADNLLLCIDQPAGGEARFNLYMIKVLSPPQREVAQARQAVLDAPPVAQALGLSSDQVKTLRGLSLAGDLELRPNELEVLRVTADQVKALQAVTFTAAIKLDPADLKALASDFSRYHQARGREARGPAEAAVVKTLRAVAERHAAEADQAQQRQLQAISALLTPQRVEQFQAIARRQRQAATRPQAPATRSAAAVGPSGS